MRAGSLNAPDTSLSNLLFGQTRGRILGLLFGFPDQTFFMRQITRLVHSSAGTVQRELRTLTSSGLIQRSENETQVLYSANRENPIYPELSALLAKTTGVFHQVSTALEPLASQIKFAFVYGSFARGTENASSDIDLLVVGKVTLDQLLEHLGPVEKALRRPINPTLFKRKELDIKLRGKHHFLKAIQKEKAVFLIGNENEFRAIR